MDLRAPDLDAHGARLLEVQRAAYRVEARLIGDERIPTLHESLGELRAAPLRWRAAYEADELLGAIAWTMTPDELDIDRLFVDPAASRRGVGRALVGSVVDTAGPRPSLVATGRGNLPALTLYESMGFTRVGDVEVLDGLWITRLRRPPGAGRPPHVWATGRRG